MNLVPEMPVEAKSAATPRTLKAIASFVFWAILFGLACTQAPLFFSNQNQYFLHGLAHSDYGFLKNDWLANTRDPTPLFSGLVALTHRHLHDWFFYAYYALIQGVYFISLLGIAEHVAGARSRPWFRLCFAALFILLHSAVLRWASARAWGVDYPWYFQAGVAGQYVLGPVLQPSVFGVLLILSVLLFLRDRPRLAAGCASLAAVVHATYLLQAALLVFAYLYVLVRERRFRDACGAALTALLLALPAATYNAVVFGPHSAEQFAQAQEILARFRIPHHTDVRLWCDGIALGQVAWIFLALFLLRGQRLFTILAIPCVAAIGLTCLQLTTDSNSLALLFPWRASVYLVPVATTIILARLLNRMEPRFRSIRILAGGTAVVLLAGTVIGGGLISYFRVGYRISAEEVPVMEYVRDHCRPGDLYMVPFDLPDRKQARPGAASGDFKPPRSVAEGVRKISFGPQRFRLFTGAPVFVDLKSIPYQDVEVLQWRERLDENDRLYTALRSPSAGPEKEWFARSGITHVIVRADQPVRWPELVEIFELKDENFRIYRYTSGGR